MKRSNIQNPYNLNAFLGVWGERKKRAASEGSKNAFLVLKDEYLNRLGASKDCSDTSLDSINASEDRTNASFVSINASKDRTDADVNRSDESKGGLVELYQPNK